MAKKENENIFVSYRREDAPDSTRRLTQRLGDAYGRNNIIFELDNLVSGQTFVRDVRHQLADCKLAIVIIGPKWGTLTNHLGNPKIDDCRDYVHTELAHILEAEIPVIPVLIEGGELPKQQSLPGELKALGNYPSVALRSECFEEDLEQLQRSLDTALAARSIIN